MFTRFRLLFQERIRRIYSSIAFYPAAIGILFLVASIGAIEFDFSPAGKDLKSNFGWLSIKDATTARSIISTIVAGVISLTVFSFSMVMIVLNQAASHMTNRVLDKLIGNRFQQVVLGIYIGTIVYGLFLLTTIRDINSGLYIPSLSIYTLIVLTIGDIFLFIYFIHFITQSVKYGVIIRRVADATQKSLCKTCPHTQPPAGKLPDTSGWYPVVAKESGVYEGFSKDGMEAFCEKNGVQIHIVILQGDFILAGTPLGSSSIALDKDAAEVLCNQLFIHDSETIEGNYFYGFKQLMEIALKALSPGINDPDTAVIAMRALFPLYALRLRQHPDAALYNEVGKVLLFGSDLSFQKVFEDTLQPIWDYGKEDRIIGMEMRSLLHQLNALYGDPCVRKFLLEIKRCARLNRGNPGGVAAW